jgi:hypothetical protein
MPTAPQPAPIDLQLPPNPPPFPDDILQRFPSLKDWQDKFNLWYENLGQSLTDANQAQSTQINNQVTQIATLQDELAAVQPGAFASGTPAAIGTVLIPDNDGNLHKALVAT